MPSSNVWTFFDHLQHREPASLTGSERLVLAFGEIRTEVNHGGFDFYLSHSYRHNAPIAAEAARVAGCRALADLIEEVIRVVGQELLQAPDEEALYQRLQQIEDDLASLTQQFYELENTADLDAAQARLVARIA